MKPITPSSRDAREFLRLVLAFIVGFIASLAVCVWLVVRFGWHEMAWWELLPTALEILLASVTGGLLVLGAVLWLSIKWRTLTATHHCISCDRKQRAPGFCEDCKIQNETHAA